MRKIFIFLVVFASDLTFEFLRISAGSTKATLTIKYAGLGLLGLLASIATSVSRGKRDGLDARQALAGDIAIVAATIVSFLWYTFSVLSPGERFDGFRKSLDVLCVVLLVSLIDFTLTFLVGSWIGSRLTHYSSRPNSN